MPLFHICLLKSPKYNPAIHFLANIAKLISREVSVHALLYPFLATNIRPSWSSVFNVTERVINNFAYKSNWFLQNLILHMRFLIHFFFKFTFSYLLQFCWDRRLLIVIMSWVKHDVFCIFIIHRSNCPYETSQWGLTGIFFFLVVEKNIYFVLKIVFV